MGAQQIAVRLPEELLDELDALVDRGVYSSRAAAVRAGIETVTALAREARDAAIVEGYRRSPPTDTEEAAAVASMRDAILEEPW